MSVTQTASSLYSIKCDGCGGTCPEDHPDLSFCHPRPSVLGAMLKLKGWLITHDHRHYCPNCHRVNDNNQIQTIDNRLYDL